jgi:hypothetical protein
MRALKSDGTSSPRAMTSRTARPSSLSWRATLLNCSPSEMTRAMLSRTTLSHSVPLPDPGPPSKKTTCMLKRVLTSMTSHSSQIVTNWVIGVEPVATRHLVCRSGCRVVTRAPVQGLPVKTHAYKHYVERFSCREQVTVFAAICGHTSMSEINFGFGDPSYDMRVHTLDSAPGWWGICTDGNIVVNGQKEPGPRALVSGDVVVLVFDRPRQILCIYLNRLLCRVLSGVMATQPVVAFGVLPGSKKRLEDGDELKDCYCMLRLLMADEVHLDRETQRISVTIKDPHTRKAPTVTA